MYSFGESQSLGPSGTASVANSKFSVTVTGMVCHSCCCSLLFLLFLLLSLGEGTKEGEKRREEERRVKVKAKVRAEENENLLNCNFIWIPTLIYHQT